MALNIVQARRRFTNVLIDVYNEVVEPTSFLRSFFKVTESASKEVSIEVRRATEKVAVDVLRGTEGNRNTLGKFSHKTWVPPYYRENVDHNSIRNYDLLFGQNEGQINEATMADIVRDVAEDLAQLRYKIERAYELQAAQVFTDGIVTLKHGDNINFGRKAGAVQDLGGGNYWDSASVDPTTSIESGIDFVRQEGKARGGEYIMILGSSALNALLANDEFKERANLRRIKLVDLNMPKQFSDVGASFHGIISVGSYTVQVWTYPQTYTNAAGSEVDYIDPKLMVILPTVTRFNMAFGGVPKIMRDANNAEYPKYIQQTRGAYSIGNYLDEKAMAHVFDISSAGIAVPVAIDTIYTAQVHS